MDTRDVLYRLNPIVPTQRVRFPRSTLIKGLVEEKVRYALIEARVQELVDLLGWEEAEKGCAELRALLGNLEHILKENA